VSTDDRRTFTAARRAQGFRSQAHLDAFYASFDHGQTCTDCRPGPPAILDDGMQPTVAPCPVAVALFVASMAEHFTTESAPSSDFTVSAVIPDSRKRNRTPQYVCYVRRGGRVDVLRGCDRDKLDRERAHLLVEGATEAA
jgi:hypothetical protein